MTTTSLIRRIRDRIGPSGRDGGFTLIEVIVAFAVFAIVSATAATAIYRSIRTSHLNQQRVDAAAVAQSLIAQAIALANKNTVATEPGHPFLTTVGTKGSAAEQLTAARTITFDAGDTCAPGVLFTVSVVVTQAQSGQFLARSDTRIACPPA
ncbi:MAG TPA: type II secretion system protein [Jatrophihabitans sp.]|jgi:prepilin-type N-terminal cleavage/methylation domain-containing protein|uniref:type IV pilus modification PilV family protein n=1 Tax=Jatrophihabitans sp. TaxID=1932789 RepID=UPI002DFAC500|nr:type II secretion system protein [Jatrophihabitans sp.]